MHIFKMSDPDQEGNYLSFCGIRTESISVHIKDITCITCLKRYYDWSFIQAIEANRRFIDVNRRLKALGVKYE